MYFSFLGGGNSRCKDRAQLHSFIEIEKTLSWGLWLIVQLQKNKIHINIISHIRTRKRTYPLVSSQEAQYWGTALQIVGADFPWAPTPWKKSSNKENLLIQHSSNFCWILHVPLCPHTYHLPGEGGHCLHFMHTFLCSSTVYQLRPAQSHCSFIWKLTHEILDSLHSNRQRCPQESWVRLCNWDCLGAPPSLDKDTGT